MDGPAENEGRVEICLQREWGTICDDGWGSDEARVVCRQLGYSDQVEHVVVHRAFFGSGTVPIHLDDVTCLGNEEMLSQCLHSGVGTHNCNHNEDAGVICTGACVRACVDVARDDFISLLLPSSPSLPPSPPLPPSSLPSPSSGQRHVHQ